MSVKTCRRCGGLTNTALCDWINSLDDMADKCFVRWVDGIAEPGCAYKERDVVTDRVANRLFKTAAIAARSKKK